MNQKVGQLEKVTKSKYFIFMKLVLGKNVTEWKASRKSNKLFSIGGSADMFDA